jgi:hypothetical protein
MEQARTRNSSLEATLNIQYEIRARDTPQQIHLVELGFATLANRGRALMNQANLPLAVRYKVFKEAFRTATQFDGLMAIKVDGKAATRYVHFSLEQTHHLRSIVAPGAKLEQSRPRPRLPPRSQTEVSNACLLDTPSIIQATHIECGTRQQAESTKPAASLG